MYESKYWKLWHGMMYSWSSTGRAKDVVFFLCSISMDVCWNRNVNSIKIGLETGHSNHSNLGVFQAGLVCSNENHNYRHRSFSVTSSECVSVHVSRWVARGGLSPPGLSVRVLLTCQRFWHCSHNPWNYRSVFFSASFYNHAGNNWNVQKETHLCGRGFTPFIHSVLPIRPSFFLKLIMAHSNSDNALKSLQV